MRWRLPFFRRWLAAAASAAAVPDVAITFLTFAATTRDAMRFTSRATKPCSRLSSPLRGGSWLEKFIGEADRAQGQTHHVANVAAPGNRQFAASASQVDHQRGRTVDAEIGDKSQMNQTSFFQSGDNFDLPASRGAYPLQKGLRIPGVSQSAGGDDSDRVGDDLLRGPVKAAQDLNRLGHRFGSEKAGAKYSFAQPGNFAVFVDGAKAAAREACDLQPNGVGTDINRGKGWHEARPTVYMPNVARSSDLRPGHQGNVSAILCGRRGSRAGELCFAARSGPCGACSRAGAGRRLARTGESSETAWRNFAPVTLCSSATRDDSRTSPRCSVAVCVKVSQSCQSPSASWMRLSPAMNCSASRDGSANSAA